MSRHQLQVRADRADVGEAVIGWDRPLRTFFVQAYATRDGLGDDDDDRILLWRGTSWCELPSAGAAIALVQPFAIVTDDLAVLLEREREESFDIEDSPLQIAMRGLVDGAGDISIDGEGGHGAR